MPCKRIVDLPYEELIKEGFQEEEIKDLKSMSR
ncbi:hypothetical protein CCP3SC15_1180004 [Gammaproteobacteria bacterium]